MGITSHGSLLYAVPAHVHTATRLGRIAVDCVAASSERQHTRTAESHPLHGRWIS
jgi:hypothetical protein